MLETLSLMHYLSASGRLHTKGPKSWQITDGW